MPATWSTRIDGLTTSVAVKAPVRVATFTPLTLYGEQTINGVAVMSNFDTGGYPDRVLVMGQPDPINNGIYDVSLVAWTRSKDFDGARDAVMGTLVLANTDDSLSENIYQLIAINPVEIGYSALSFTSATAASVLANSQALAAAAAAKASQMSASSSQSSAAASQAAAATSAQMAQNYIGTVKNTTSDTTPSVLNSKLIVDGLVKKTINPGANESLQVGMPAGVGAPFFGNTVPAGWLLCDGSAVSRTTYTALFAAIGILHGAGDGITTFNLPLGDGVVLRGAARTPAANSGLPNITGSGNAATSQATFNNHNITKNGTKVRMVGGTLSGLATGSDYYAIVVNSNTLSFATTYMNAVGGVATATVGQGYNAGTPATISLGTAANTAVLQAWPDPDSLTRKAAQPGGASAGVGSVQDDDVLDHYHYTGGAASSTSGGSQFPGSGSQANIYTGSMNATQSGNHVETRMRNMAANWIIKT